MKTVCIDARFWGIKHTGIGRYVQELINNLPATGDMKFVVITHPQNRTENDLKDIKKYYANHHPYSILSQFEMFFLLQKIKPDLLHVPHFTIPLLWSGNLVVTIHDLIKHLSTGKNTTTHNQLLYGFKQLGYKIIIYLAIHRARKIITPTNFWKNQIVNIYKIPEKKITVTYEGVSFI